MEAKKGPLCLCKSSLSRLPLGATWTSDRRDLYTNFLWTPLCVTPSLGQPLPRLQQEGRPPIITVPVGLLCWPVPVFLPNCPYCECPCGALGGITFLLPIPPHYPVPVSDLWALSPCGVLKEGVSPCLARSPPIVTLMGLLADSVL